jgi:uncharacterized protein YigA (DUF484 family)
MQKPAKTHIIDMMAGDVRDYLIAHPDFLGSNADLLSVLVPPHRRLDDGVKDFQHFQIAHLQEDAGSLRAECDHLQKLIVDNLRRERRLHSAALGLLEAQSLEELIAVIRQDLRILLDHEAVEILIEEGGPSLADARVVTGGFVHEWLPEREILCESDVYGVPELFAAKFGKVRSQALVRLSIGSKMPPGMLALGHRDSDHYASGTATEQVLHLAAIVEFCIRKWLPIP